jgi:uncharacterized protein YjiS (DUF1127 family)
MVSSANQEDFAMRDYALNRAISLGELDGFSLTQLARNWTARRAVGKLRDLDDHMLADIGVDRGEIDWAAGLPLTVNAALALEEKAWNRRRGGRRGFAA